MFTDASGAMYFLVALTRPPLADDLLTSRVLFGPYHTRDTRLQEELEGIGENDANQSFKFEAMEGFSPNSSDMISPIG